MDTREARRKVAKDAMDLLKTRVEAVENLAVLGVAVAEAEHAVAAVQQRLDAAREEYARGYRAASDHGWSASELQQLGCEPASSPRRSTKPRRTAETATPQTNTRDPASTVKHTTDRSGQSTTGPTQSTSDTGNA